MEILTLKKIIKTAERWWLTPVILATQEAEIRIAVQSQPRQIVPRDAISKKTLHKKGLAEWLKV
jgi:hypothetical protein